MAVTLSWKFYCLLLVSFPIQEGHLFQFSNFVYILLQIKKVWEFSQLLRDWQPPKISDKTITGDIKSENISNTKLMIRGVLRIIQR